MDYWLSKPGKILFIYWNVVCDFCLLYYPQSVHVHVLAKCSMAKSKYFKESMSPIICCLTVEALQDATFFPTCDIDPMDIWTMPSIGVTWKPLVRWGSNKLFIYNWCKTATNVYSYLSAGGWFCELEAPLSVGVEELMLKFSRPSERPAVLTAAWPTANTSGRALRRPVRPVLTKLSTAISHSAIL